VLVKGWEGMGRVREKVRGFFEVLGKFMKQAFSGNKPLSD